jgi:hypothetical protein
METRLGKGAQPSVRAGLPGPKSGPKPPFRHTPVRALEKTTCRIIRLVVARGGIEPPTRGFSDRMGLLLSSEELARRANHGLDQLAEGIERQVVQRY